MSSARQLNLNLDDIKPWQLDRDCSAVPGIARQLVGPLFVPECATVWFEKHRIDFVSRNFLYAYAFFNFSVFKGANMGL